MPFVSPSFLRARSLSALLALATSVPGCARVPVYERGLLAHPTMAVSDPTRSSEEHVRAVQEGATGGGTSAGGGCGCN